jgi:hypothetical protein
VALPADGVEASGPIVGREEAGCGAGYSGVGRSAWPPDPAGDYADVYARADAYVGAGAGGVRQSGATGSGCRNSDAALPAVTS